MENPKIDDVDIILICSENEFQDELDNNKRKTQIKPHTPSSQGNQSRDPYTPCHSRSSPKRIKSPRRAHSKSHRNNNFNKESIDINKKSNTTTNPKRSKQKTRARLQRTECLTTLKMIRNAIISKRVLDQIRPNPKV